MAKCMQAEQCSMLIKLAQHIKGLGFYWAIFLAQFTMARGNTIKHLAAEALILLAEDLKERQHTTAVKRGSTLPESLIMCFFFFFFKLVLFFELFM